MKFHKIIFITSNAKKAEQLARHLDYPVLHQKLDLPEVQSLSLQEIVKHKAKEAYKYVKGPVLVEDTSLVFLTLKNCRGRLLKGAGKHCSKPSRRI